MYFPLRFYNFSSPVLKLPVIFETNVSAIVMCQLAKGMICSCCPIYRDCWGYFLAAFQLVGKRQLFVFVLWCEDSLKLKGGFVDLLGSFQHNTCIVLSKICSVLKIDIYK